MMKSFISRQLWQSVFAITLTVGLGQSLFAQGFGGCAIQSTDPAPIVNSTAVDLTPADAAGAPVTSTIVVSGLDTRILDLNVRTFITHTFNADLDITLTSPAGTVVTLSTDNGAGNDNVFNGTIFDDQNATSLVDFVTTNLVPIVAIQPEEPLSAFFGENPNGTWTITIDDDLTGDVGSLASWSLDFVTTPVALPAFNTATATVSTPTNILDVATINIPVTVSSPNNFITDVNLLANITHTFAADMDIFLISPAGTVVQLSTDNGGGNDNIFAPTLWDDDANPGGTLPYTNNGAAAGPNGVTTDQLYGNLVAIPTLTPESPLSRFWGENPNGVWTLRVTDDLAGDVGVVNSFTITVQSALNQLCTVASPLTALNLAPTGGGCNFVGTLTAPALVGGTLCNGGTLEVSVNGAPFVSATTSVTLPQGANALVWRITTVCGVDTEPQTVNVSNTAPTFTVCPSSVTINLGPGACETVVNYPTPCATDCSGFPLTAGSPGNTTQTWANTGQRGVFFDITNVSAQPIQITSIDVQTFTPGTPATDNLTAFMTNANTTFVGNQAVPGNWSAVSAPTTVTLGVGTPALRNIPLSSPVTLPAGATKGVYVVGTTGFGGGPVAYQSSAGAPPATSNTFTDGTITATGGIYRFLWCCG
jgi:subtilisin-like proprotein convertase family protein